MTRKLSITGHGLKEFFTELRAEKLTGEVIVLCSEGRKSVGIIEGEITHCSSTCLDDRLGDVLYRKGKINIDVFIDLAGKVDHQNRFGDLLVKNAHFDLLELWESLVLQSKEILQSLVFQEQMNLEIISGNELKTPDFGLRFKWDQALDDALEELRDIHQFEKSATQNPTLRIDENHREVATSDFLRDMISLIENHQDFNVIVNEKTPLAKSYTIRTLFEMYCLGIISDTWNIFPQVLTKQADDSLKQLVQSANEVFTAMEALVKKRNLSGWDMSLKRANRILDDEFGPGITLIPQLGFSIQQIRKALALNRAFKSSAMLALSHRWRVPVASFIQESMHKSLLFLLFELSNNRQMEEEITKIHEKLVTSGNAYFTRMSEAIS